MEPVVVSVYVFCVVGVDVVVVGVVHVVVLSFILLRDFASFSLE